MSKEELWQAALAQLQFHISPANFATWLKNTHITAQKEGQLTISVPNNFSKEWLENKYNKLIFHILRGLDNEIKEVRYAVGGFSPATEAKEAPPIPKTSQQPAENQLEFQELSINRTTSLNPRYTFENFIEGPSNQFIKSAILSPLVFVTGILTYTLSPQLDISLACRCIPLKSSANTSNDTGLLVIFNTVLQKFS